MVGDRDQSACHGIIQHAVGGRAEDAARDVDVRDRCNGELRQPILRLLRRGGEQLTREEVVQRPGQETARAEVDVAA
ncbi:MAG TPA: hypothetical protein VNG04_10540, partial [Candidatus Acidoferrum sp.]|nr:hypothetical protein [Candidatus Acidoferrum sp.]